MLPGMVPFTTAKTAPPMAAPEQVGTLDADANNVVYESSSFSYTQTTGKRLIIVDVFVHNDPAAIPDSVKIGGSGGAAMTELQSQVFSYRSISRWVLNDNSITSGTVYVALPGSASGLSLHAYCITPGESTTPFSTDTATGTDVSASLSVTVKPQGVALFASMCRLGGTISWTDATELDETTPNDKANGSTAYTQTEGSVTATATWPAATQYGALAASWR